MWARSLVYGGLALLEYWRFLNLLLPLLLDGLCLLFDDGNVDVDE